MRHRVNVNVWRDEMHHFEETENHGTAHRTQQRRQPNKYGSFGGKEAGDPQNLQNKMTLWPQNMDVTALLLRGPGNVFMPVAHLPVRSCRHCARGVKAEVYGTIKERKKKKAGKRTVEPLPWNGANSREWDVSSLPSSSDASWWCSWLSSSPPRRWSKTVAGVCSTSCWEREHAARFVSALGWNLTPSWQLSVFWVSFGSSLS